MVDREIFSRRLAALRGYLERLEELRPTSEAEFRRSPALHHLAERYLHLAVELRSWAGFRNILVHEYLDIDHGIAWGAIQNELGDLDAFARWATDQLT